MPTNNPRKFQQLGQASMAGVMLAACIFVGTAIGVGLDRWLETRPWFTLFFMIMGIVAGFYNVVRIVLSINLDKKP